MSNSKESEPILKRASELLRDYCKNNQTRVIQATQYVVQAYQYMNFNLEKTLSYIKKECCTDPCQEKGFQAALDQMQKMIQDYLEPNRNLIYSIHEEQEESQESKEKANQIHNEMLKTCHENFETKEKGDEFFLFMIDVYCEQCNLDKEATIKKMFDPYIETDLIIFRRNLTKRLLVRIDEYLKILDPDADNDEVPPPNQQTSHNQTSTSTFNQTTQTQPPKEEEVLEKDKLEEEMKKACIEFFDNNENEGREYLHHLQSEFKRHGFDPSKTNEAVLNIVRDYHYPWSLVGKLRQLNTKVLEKMGFYMICVSEEETTKQQTNYRLLCEGIDDVLEGADLKVDGLSDLDESELPKFSNEADWKKHYPDDYWDEWIQPPEQTYRRTSQEWNQFLRRMETRTHSWRDTPPPHPKKNGIDFGVRFRPAKEGPEGFKYEGGFYFWDLKKSRYSDKKTNSGGSTTGTGPTVNYSRLGLREMDQYQRILLTSGYPNLTPVKELEKISKLVAHNNKEFTPVAVSPEVMIRNVIKIENLLDNCLRILKQDIDQEADLDFTMFDRWDEWNGLARVYAKFRMLKKVGKSYNKLDFDELKNLEAINAALRRFRGGILMRSIITGHNASKKTPYFFIFSPYHWCFDCQKICFEDDRERISVYELDICNDCNSAIYHLDTATFFKMWNWNLNPVGEKPNNRPIVPVLEDSPYLREDVKPTSDGDWILDANLLLNYCAEHFEEITKNDQYSDDQKQKEWKSFLTNLDVEQLRDTLYLSSKKPSNFTPIEPPPDKWQTEETIPLLQEFEKVDTSPIGDFFKDDEDEEKIFEECYSVEDSDDATLNQNQYQQISNSIDDGNVSSSEGENDLEEQEEEEEEGYSQGSDYDRDDQEILHPAV